MQTVPVTLELPKETYELGKGVAALTKAIITALKDGWQPGQDLPVIVMAAFQQLSAVEGIDLIDDEMKESPEKFAQAIAISLAEVYSAVKSKDEAAA